MNSGKGWGASSGDVERALVGAILVGGLPSLEVAVEAGVRGDDFAIESVRSVWLGCVAASDDLGEVSALSVVDVMHRRGLLVEVGGAGGADTVRQLAAMMARETVSVGLLARSVIERSKTRKLTEVFGALREAAASGAQIDDVIEEGIAALDSLSRRRAFDDGLVDVDAALRECLDPDLDREEWPTGFRDLDHILGGGLRPGQLVIVGARPAMGKSAFGQGVLTSMADRHIKGVLFSLEMSGRELIERELAAEGIDSRRIRKRKLSPLVAAMPSEKIAMRQLFRFDRGVTTGSSVVAKMRRLYKKGVRVAVVDYLTLLDAGDSRYQGQRVNELADITSALKRCALDLGVAIIVLSQLSRTLTTRTDKRPQLQDLRDSGAIEQDGDIVAFLHRPAYYDEGADQTLAEVIVAKNRSGPCGIVELSWVAERTSFTNRAAP